MKAEDSRETMGLHDMSSITCNTNDRTRLNGESRLLAKLSFNHGFSSRLSSVAKINEQVGTYRNIKLSLSSVSNLVANENVNFGLSEELNESAIGNINGYTNASLSAKSRLFSTGQISTGSTDKFSGYKPTFRAYEKLYPTQDIFLKSKVTNNDITLNDQVNIVTEDNSVISTENNDLVAVNGFSQIYSNIDDGVFTGDYVDNGKVGFVLSDDSSSVLFTYQVFNDGDVQYKFQVTKPLSVAKLSYLAIRASAPFDNYIQKKPQQYKFYDIKLEDPNGNLIVQYEDIPIRGDSNFTTYISKPLINNLLLPTWDERYPLMDESGPYTLTLNLTFNCNIYPFDNKFSDGYEQTCIINKDKDVDLSPASPNPFIGLNISSIEIGNNGGIGILRDSYLNFYSQVNSKSERVRRTLLPTQLFTYDFNNGIYPQASSIWQSTTNEVNFVNTTLSGSSHLLNKIRNDRYDEYISLSDSTPVQSSGRIVLKFNTKPDREAYDNYIDGAFSFGGNKEFNDAKLVNYLDNDNFFDIDTLELKIIAKKFSSENPDYIIDVVGYSDDKLLNVTPAIGGFLQNSDALNFDSNNIPDVSGFYSRSFGISDSSLSDLSSYFKQDISPNGDHYSLSSNPVVNSSSFKEYTVPLKIYQDPRQLGYNNYSISSFFENLYLDISPIPSGASICSVKLVVNYKPANALMIHTLGSPQEKNAIRKNLRLVPSSNTAGNQINTNLPLSGILTGLKTPAYIKSNYARRWRGIEGGVISGGDFNASKFDFSFNHKQAIHPFLSSYIDFSNINGADVYSSNNDPVGQSASNLNVLSNIGWRYSSDQLFTGTTTPYKSIAWKNNIFDAFDRSVRLSSEDYLELSILDTDSFDDYGDPDNTVGFSLFIRFTPDKVSNAVLNDNLVFAYENGTTWSMALVYEGGILKLKVKESNGNIITLSDTRNISEYQFPLSVLITYNDDNTYRYKLYTENELFAAFTNLRATSSPQISTYLLDGGGVISIGSSSTYTTVPPLPMFLHEVGSSNGRCNIVEYKDSTGPADQISAIDFFSSHRMHFNSISFSNARSNQSLYINDDISLWHLGDFKVCQFSPDFDFFTKREGKDFLTFSLKHDGQAYSSITNLPLPSDIKLSGVAYHTQIENDFLRFNLSNIPTIDKARFYAVTPRICKTLPRGYQFSEEAICVDTIVEHDTNNNIIWPNGKIGPKLIVSLYTKNQEVSDLPSKMFGLINRSTHYLEPSGCIRKLTSKFTFDDLFDDSEPWAMFDKDSYNKEFREKYLSKDIDDMFLQYDLVYPSGSPFSSLIKIHNANVRLDDSIFIGDTTNNQLGFATSGKKYQVENLNLFVSRNHLIQSGINLFVDSIGPIGSGMNLFIDSSGFPCYGPPLNLYSLTIGTIDTQDQFFGSSFGSSPIRGLGLSVSGQWMRETSMPLYISPSGSGINSYVGFNVVGQEYVFGDGQWADSLNLRIRGISPSFNAYPSSNMPMFVEGQEFATEINHYASLFVICDDFSRTQLSEGLSLHTVNYPISASLANSSSAIRWDHDNVGSNITVQDNSYAYVDSDDNIRGVDLLCYGTCSSTNRCSEAVIDIHGIKWYEPEVCVDGGIFRAKSTYTNLSYPSGSFRHTVGSDNFSSLITETSLILSTENNNSISLEQLPTNVTYDPMPYSGHFYGIRKYTGLAPNLPYYINITGKSGSTNPIDIPTEIIEVEYNKNEDDETSTDYSGFRLVANGDYSGVGNQFGKSIASKDNVLAIGSPNRSIVYNSGIGSNLTLQEAGTVFLYRRQARPSGYDWPLDNYKSPWVLETALTLPSGLLKDYYTQSQIDLNLPNNLKPTQTTWFVGQEGRQFGHSLDLSINKQEKSLGENSRQVLVVGGPSAKWTPRQFDNNPPSGVNIGLMIFTDEFTPRIPAPLPGAPFRTIGYEEVLASIQDKDIVFNYFGNPRIKFDTKLMICQPIADSPDIVPPSYPDRPDFITLTSISRNYGYNEDKVKTSGILNGMKSAFFEAFPYDSGKLHNNIPPILGLYVDNSSSLGRESLEPAIDQFINFYKSYSFASGLKDFNGVRESGQVIEYVPDDYGAENWIEMSKLILSEVLDTGNLVANNQVRFLTGSVGTFNTNLGAFNIPPESGGKVYVFEKESGSWNLIQEIRSPNVTYSNPDRFGHAVSISDDSEVIVVGSPYINQAVTVYERNDEERDRFYSSLYNWASQNRSEKYASGLLSYEKSNQSVDAQKALYLTLDQDDKFKSRVDLGVQEYQNIYTFDYSNMQPNGSWSFIPNAVAPTSRLGYSVDVNEDGSIIVASSPTDSMNLYNDADIYYSHNMSYRGKYYSTGYSDPYGIVPNHVKSAWSSSVNAGSIHVFESRKYYPHNQVIEYGRFGNLHEITSNDTPDSGHFHYLADIFEDKNFVKTEFTDSKIPKEAGLAFIITPAIDALSVSDEVYNNILDWLALGDRNLVLVGNDPIWEGNGKYKNSNDILNKLLERLHSRMRIVPARSRYESLPDGYSSYNNIIPSFVPQGSTSTYVQRSLTRGSGVADIKIYYPGYNEVMPCTEVDDCTPESTKIQIQSRCEMPLVHYGDLRAQWNASCCTNGGLLVYGYNWPLIFGSYSPACGDVEFSEKPLKNFEPIPLLAASEKVTYDVTYPAVPAQYKSYPIYETVYESTPYYTFGSPVSQTPNFIWDTDNAPANLTLNLTGSFSEGRFYKPEDGLLQAKATSKVDVTPFTSKKMMSGKGYYCVEHSYSNTTSKVIVLAGVETESISALLGNDQNIKFYANLVSKTLKDRGASDIAQLGAWTGRTKFTDGNSNSYLKTLFTSNRNYVTEDVDTSFQSINRMFLDGRFNVAWVANIISQPSQDELNDLKLWMANGDKKLIITCGNNLDSIDNAEKLCGKLGVSIGAVLLPYLDQYPQVNAGLSINQQHQAGGQYNNNKIEYFTSPVSFHPLKLTGNGVGVAYDNQPIYDEVPQTNITNYWNMNAGVAKLSIPVESCSGYKLFITTLADSPAQIAPIFVDVENATYLPKLPCPVDYASSSLNELDNNGEIVNYKALSNSIPQVQCEGTSTKTVDIQVGSNVTTIDVYISCAIPRILSGTTIIPKTTKLVGLSGVLIPVYESASIVGTQIPTNRFEVVKVSDEQPEYTETVQVIRPISTDNTKYCSSKCEAIGLGGQLIDDGPIVAAQEIEILSAFNVGVARSRITVITDSSILQGKYVADTNGVIPSDTLAFIRSLYPETNFPSTNYGRQFDVYNKIISPERGSPSKYFAQGALSGLNINFGNSGTVTVGNINQYESEYIPKHITRPKVPWEDEVEEDKINEIKNQFISGFLSSQIQHASTARFSGIVDGIMYSDATVAGGLPPLFKSKGYDYLDLDKLPSGYRGDLFGYSVCVKGNKILVGSPFSAFGSETVTPWNSGVQLHLGSDGGAGSVYMFEKSSNNAWACSRKFRPSSLMGQLSGINSTSDHFGHSVAIQNDTIAIGSPNHDYGNFYECIFDNGSFARKNFNAQFDTPSYVVKDLGYSGIRQELNINGTYGNNAGAIYVYENKITDWENKQQSWKLVEKVVSDPTVPTGSMPLPERFGSNIYLTRPYRSDADYTILAGCYSTSGNGILNVGAAYAKDIMLRKQLPSLANSGAWINARVFGETASSDEHIVSLKFSNSGNNTPYYASGIVVANSKGEVFIEVSGQDPSTKGFIAHRPYIESVLGQYQYGQILENGMVLFCEGKYPPPSSEMNLFINVENSAYVYNTLGLYGSVMTDVVSTYPSGLNLFIESPSGSLTSSLNLAMPSGIGSLKDNLNLQVRGK